MSDERDWKVRIRYRWFARMKFAYRWFAALREALDADCDWEEREHQIRALLELTCDDVWTREIDLSKVTLSPIAPEKSCRERFTGTEPPPATPSDNIVTVCGWCPNLRVLNLPRKSSDQIVILLEGEKIASYRWSRDTGETTALQISVGICQECKAKHFPVSVPVGWYGS